MWKPGFAYLERQSALIHGFHPRVSACARSAIAALKERPGVVLGLDRRWLLPGHGVQGRGGGCRGGSLAYLTEREQMNRVYREVMPPVRLADGRRLPALAYVVNRENPQYTGRLSHETLLAMVRQGHGESGACRDYVLNTLTAMHELGIEDHALAWLGEALSP